jgi:hypothetical protein
MGKFKFKLKEERQTLKPKDVDPALLTRLEKQYGPINMEYDFFDKDLKILIIIEVICVNIIRINMR